ncbi:uncharacterized protein LOC141651893 [Silene latifolia]|uniref:uncharacterized protein LOC141651893 n=1 Tax=Silene latifolia TaxID=37657 RepID=UPI003D770CCA
MKQKVLNSGYFLFDNKPMVIKPWVLDIELTKEDVKNVPAWIRFQDLPLKFWGKGLPKIASLIGKYVKSDTPTELKTRLGFARVMVELQLGQKFPSSVRFMDEKNKMVTVKVEYEWKPIVCTNCNQLGHDKGQCRKGRKSVSHKPVRKEWRLVKKASQVVQAVPLVVTQTPDPETPTKIYKVTVDEEIEKTPEVGLTGDNKGSLSPVRLKPTEASRAIHVSPSYMEVLSGSKSPKSGIGINVYAFNGIQERENLWLKLQDISNKQQGSWAIGGDFNCVLQPNERLGGDFNVAAAEPFQNCLDPPETRIYSRLDRFFVNQEWLDAFPGFYANFLPEGNSALIQQELEVSKIAQEFQEAKVAFLRQKAKAHWLSEGDLNTAYFHGLIKSRRNKNFVHQILDHKNNLHSDQEGIQQAFLNYYQMLLGSKNDTREVRKAIVRKGRTCTEQHIQILMAHVSSEEIKDIIFHIPDDKAPGPDGYSSRFFNDSWETIGVEVTQAIKDFFISGRMLKQLNTTLITLILKTERPTSVLQYRPIACCNVIYKCISKILCNKAS